MAKMRKHPSNTVFIIAVLAPVVIGLIAYLISP
jgi:hypothetical protein